MNKKLKDYFKQESKYSDMSCSVEGTRHSVFGVEEFARKMFAAGMRYAVRFRKGKQEINPMSVNAEADKIERGGM